jgi:hypothetical protein
LRESIDRKEEWKSMIGVETFIKIPKNKKPLNVLREKVVPVIDHIEKKEIGQGYSFLIHDKDSGVPTKKKGRWFHLRFHLYETRVITTYPKITDEKILIKEELKKFKQCKMTRIETLRNVSGFDDDERIRVFPSEVNYPSKSDTVWDILAEMSSFFVRMVRGYDDTIPILQMWQWYHYFENIIGKEDFNSVKQYDALNNIAKTLKEEIEELEEDYEGK